MIPIDKSQKKIYTFILDMYLQAILISDQAQAMCLDNV